MVLLALVMSAAVETNGQSTNRATTNTISIIPQPLTVKPGSGTFIIGQGTKIFVDGQSPDAFSKKIQRGGKLALASSDGFRETGQLDELKFFNQALGAAAVAERLQGRVSRKTRHRDGLCDGAPLHC